MPVPADESPASAFTRIFGSFMPGGSAEDQAALLRLQNERRSVLDAVAKSYGGLLSRLGRDDRQKLEAHLTMIRDLEGRLAATGSMPSAASACAKPAATTMDRGTHEQFPEVVRLQTDLMTMAMACDLTRVGTLQWEVGVGGVRFSWLGATRGHHDMSHDGDGVTATRDMLTKINTWYSQQLAYLIGAMKKIPEGSGTLLDNTLIVWVNELSKGNAHSHPDMPYVLAGRAGGALRTGRYLRYGSDPHNNLLVSILNAMDVPATTFGNPRYCSGPLRGLLG